MEGKSLESCLTHSNDASFCFPLKWTEAGKCGVSGLSAAQSVSICGYGNAQHHPQEMGANSVKV